MTSAAADVAVDDVAAGDKKGLESILEGETWLAESSEQIMARMSPELLDDFWKNAEQGQDGEELDGGGMSAGGAMGGGMGVLAAMAAARHYKRAALVHAANAEWEAQQATSPAILKTQEGMAAIRQDVDNWVRAQESGDEASQRMALDRVRFRFEAMSDDIKLRGELGEKIGQDCFVGAQNAREMGETVKKGLQDILKDHPGIKGTEMEDALSSGAKNFFDSLKSGLEKLFQMGQRLLGIKSPGESQSKSAGPAPGQ